MFVIIGGGDQDELLQHLAEAQGIKIIFTGKIDNADALRIMKTFKILVFPSLAESFGLVPLEAMFIGEFPFSLYTYNLFAVPW